jgi:PAS domain S-box-containing protein
MQDILKVNGTVQFDKITKKYQFSNPILNTLACSLYKFDTPILITTADSLNPKIVFANVGFTRMTGYSEEELIGKNPNMLQGNNTDREVIDRLKNSLIENKHFKGSTGNYKKDGSIFYNQWGIEPIINEDGVVTNYISVHNDVTEFREQQLKLKESQKLLQKEIEQKNKFFSIIAHDLRNPLSGFMTLTDLMTEKGMDISINQMFEMIKKLNDSAKNLNELLSNLLTWSRSQTDNLEVDNKRINLKSKINKILNLFIANADSKNINLINEIRPNSELLSDEFIFSTIIRNLINNAIKFTPKDGEVRIKLSTEPGFKIISVIDNGIGMSQEKINKIFDLENKAVSKGTAGEKGTGIGLKLCKELAIKQGGDLKVESSLGNGSSFHWYIQN